MSTPLPAQGRRLTRKTAWQDTPYGAKQPTLATRLVAQGLKRKAQAALREQSSLDKHAENNAWAKALASVESVSITMDREGTNTPCGEVEEMKPHSSHHLLKVGRIEAIFCKRCAAYATRTMLRNLRRQCSGTVAACSQRNYRLLQLGMLPGPGVRIPPQALRKRKRCW